MIFVRGDYTEYIALNLLAIRTGNILLLALPAICKFLHLEPQVCE